MIGNSVGNRLAWEPPAPRVTSVAENWPETVTAEADELGTSVRERCLAMADPGGTEMFDHVYAERHPVIEKERAEFVAYQASFEEAR